MKILLLSDIHANYPALKSVITHIISNPVDLVINGGDSLVYGPFPNETMQWLQEHCPHSILGNTDKKVIKLLKGKSFKKPRKHEKRIMYTWTAKTLTSSNAKHLCSLQNSKMIEVPCTTTGRREKVTIGIFHGSPARDHEFLFDDTPDERFLELSSLTMASIVIVGHSHTPFHKYIGDTHFINPGSVGRMFDSIPKVSFAVLNLTSKGIEVKHHRLDYDVDRVISGLKKNKLPSIYGRMFKEGRKLN